MAADVSLMNGVNEVNGHLCNGVPLPQSEPEFARRMVLKFGGTVCGRLPVEVADICLSTFSEGPIAVVCSARSGKSKVEGTTNLLLKAARDASKPGSSAYDKTVSDILHQHIEGTTYLSPQAAERVVRDFTQECENLKAFLGELSVRGGLDADSEDRVLCVGERLSAQLMTALLEDRGMPAEYVDLSDISVADGIAKPQRLSQDFFKRLSSLIGQRIRACGDKVPVITGFFGRIPGGLLDNCGRGYSDLLAAIVAVGVNANELQVWKEVSGVFTADPRKVPTATLLSKIDPAEANGKLYIHQMLEMMGLTQTRLELTFFGSEVLHHFTIEQCIPKIPIRIKNVREPERSGTLIQQVKADKKVVSYDDRRPKRPTAVTVKEHITIVNVHSHRKVGSPDFLREICSILARWHLSVDLFELNETHVSLAVHSRSSVITSIGQKDDDDIQSQHQNLHCAIQELQDYGSVEVHDNMAILSLIGRGLKRSKGMAGKMFSALGNNDINIEMISQGASEINISCVITERDALRALNIVHTELFTFLE